MKYNEMYKNVQNARAGTRSAVPPHVRLNHIPSILIHATGKWIIWRRRQDDKTEGNEMYENVQNERPCGAPGESRARSCAWIPLSSWKYRSIVSTFED